MLKRVGPGWCTFVSCTDHFNADSVLSVESRGVAIIPDSHRCNNICVVIILGELFLTLILVVATDVWQQSQRFIDFISLFEFCNSI